MPRPTLLRPLVFLGSFAATLAVFLTVAERPPMLALQDAPPVLVRADADPDDSRGGSTAAGPSGGTHPEERRAVPAASPPAPDDAFDRARFDDALRRLRAAVPSRRVRLLSSKRALVGARLVQDLIAAGIGEEGLRRALALLEEEADPLAQAVLLQYVTLFEDDPRALTALDGAARSLLADPSRPVHAQLAVDGLLAAMGRQGVEPAALVHHVAATSDDPVLLRDLWMGLSRHDFDFATNRALLAAGLGHDSPAARFGAAESLRMFALDGHLTQDEFVAEFAPVLRAEHDRNNRLLFLETLGAVGGAAATPLLLDLARSAGDDAETRRLAAATLALHGTEDVALSFCREALALDDAEGRRAAITALGALPSEAATEALTELVDAADDPQEKLLALRALQGKTDAPLETFLDAAGAPDDALRRAASRHLVHLDEATLDEEGRARLAEWRRESARNDPDPQVRVDAALAAYLGDEETGEALLRERLERDASPRVRGAAASALFLTGWARGDEAALERVRGFVANEDPTVRRHLRGQLGRITQLEPDEVRRGLREQLRMLDFVSSVAPAGPGAKDVFGMQQRFVERLLARMAP